MTYVDPLAEVRNKLATPAQGVQSAGNNWRVDPEYDNTVRNIQTGISGLQSNIDLTEQRAKSDLQKNQQELVQSRDKTLQMLQEKLANQGIGRSSINIEETGNLQDKYATGKTDLETSYQRSMEDLARETLGKYQGYNDQLAQAQIQRASRQEAFDKQQALEQAQAETNKKAADEMRAQLDDLKKQLLTQLTPQSTPTGQMTLPPPPPAPKMQMPKMLAPPSPQQQLQSAGIDPKYLQGLLKVRGFDPGVVDGIFGINSQKALAAWKQSVGLPATADINSDIFQQLLSSGLGNISTTGGLSAFPQSGPARRSLI